jgi:SAM-dependent methyltransferase
MGTLSLKHKIKSAVIPVIRSRGQTAFVLQLPANARLLDIGCGDTSPWRVKSVRPDLHYVGLDIDSINHADVTEIADEYHLAKPTDFDGAIRAVGSRAFDAVICSHNIEHTEKPFQVIEAACSALRPGGQLYLAFPSEKTATLPHRKGTLNFYDDETHVWLPVFDEVVACLQRNGIDLVYQVREYYPAAYFLLGVVTEPYSALKRQVGPHAGTWALYGFESIIWGQKSGGSRSANEKSASFATAE